jgi:hypothetical protein
MSPALDDRLVIIGSGDDSHLAARRRASSPEENNARLPIHDHESALK